MEQTPPVKIVIRPHWRAFGVWYFAIFLLSFAPFNNPEAVIKPWQGVLIAFIIAAGVIVKALTSRLVITPQTIEQRGGLFTRAPVSLETARLERIRIMRGLTQRLLGVGVLQFLPKDDGPFIRFWGVAEPVRVKKEIEALLAGG